MATSGSVDFSLSRTNIITMALQSCNVLAEGVAASAQQLTDGSLFLNSIVKAFQSDGMPLWALKNAYILPMTGVSSMDAGGSSHFVHSYTQTTLSAAAASGASTVVITSATGFAASQVIGIELSDGTMQWTTINGALSGTTVTLTAVLTGAASSGAQVYTYATSVRAYRPLRVLHAITRNVTDNADGHVSIISHSDYADIGNKTESSYPTQLYYDPQLDTGLLYFFPRFSNGDRVVLVRYHRPYEDFDAAGDTPDFPQEWYMAIVMTLAWTFSFYQEVPTKKRQELAIAAKYWKDLALGFAMEEDSVQFFPASY